MARKKPALPVPVPIPPTKPSPMPHPVGGKLTLVLSLLATGCVTRVYVEAPSPVYSDATLADALTELPQDASKDAVPVADVAAVLDVLQVKPDVAAPVDVPNPCDDHDPCTLDQMGADACEYLLNPICDDGNPCTWDQCQPNKSCKHQVTDGASCGFKMWCVGAACM